MEISVNRCYQDQHGWHFVVPGGVIDFLEGTANEHITAVVRWCRRQKWNNTEICQYLEYLYNEGEL